MNPYFTSRRSIRAFTSQPVSEELLNAVLEAAVHAPNTGNMQLYSVVVTRTEEGKQALAPLHFNQPAVTAASVVLTVCLDVNRYCKWCRQRRAVPGMDNFQTFVYSLIDATIFAQQIVSAAEMEGLGTCHMGTTTYTAPEIARVLELPAGVVPVCTVTMGYPAVDPPVTERLPLEAVVHQERYHDYTTADIDRLYGPKEALPDNIQYTADNGKETLAQVFTDIRYTKRDNEHFSEVLYKFLKVHGFPFPE